MIFTELSKGRRDGVYVYADIENPIIYDVNECRLHKVTLIDEGKKITKQAMDEVLSHPWPEQKQLELRLEKDKIRATVMEGVSYAKIGLNSEHGKYGMIFFKREKLRDSKENPNITYLPMEAERRYRVEFMGRNGRTETVFMLGADIVSANKAFIKESNRRCTAELEARLQGQCQASQQQEQMET